MKVLIVGLGSIALKHIQALKELVNPLELVALRSGHNKNTPEGVRNIFDLKELDFKPDFAIVSNPTSNRYSVLKNLTALNCPLFIEKPAIDDLNKGEEISELFRKHNTVSYVGLSLRFLPCLNFLKENLKKDTRINEVNVYCGSYLPDWRPGTDFRKGYSANHEMGGGVHLDLIHELDYVYWIFGPPQSSNRKLRNKSSLNISAYDYANYYLEYNDYAVNVVLNYYRLDAKRTCEIVMEDDTWTVDLIENSVTSHKNGIIFQSDFDRAQNYKIQLKYFLDCVTQKKQAMNTFEDSLNVLKIVLNENAKQ
ncbi:MAG: oxidoreductase, Gfo/Idh/MocA family [Bacteroidetes bacterium]|nr:oxidoreductase, Gfo/Idh/MocA family [Bacteroidota bacterium]